MMINGKYSILMINRNYNMEIKLDGCESKIKRLAHALYKAKVSNIIDWYEEIDSQLYSTNLQFSRKI